MMHGTKRIPRKLKKIQKSDLPYIISGGLLYKVKNDVFGYIFTTKQW